MWAAPFAIQPVARHAVLTRALVEVVEDSLSVGDELDERKVELCYDRFEQQQPALAARLGRLLTSRRDETALALGYFFAVSLFAAFERAFGVRLQAVTREGLEAATTALALEAELRKERGDEPLELEDVLVVQQPAVFGWMNEHIESALGASAELSEESVDLDDVELVVREVSAMVLAMSYAVEGPQGVLTGIAQA